MFVINTEGKLGRLNDLQILVNPFAMLYPFTLVFLKIGELYVIPTIILEQEGSN